MFFQLFVCLDEFLFMFLPLYLMLQKELESCVREKKKKEMLPSMDMERSYAANMAAQKVCRPVHVCSCIVCRSMYSATSLIQPPELGMSL